MSDEAQVGGSIVMDVAEWLCIVASSGFGSYVGQIGTGHGVIWTPVKLNGHPAPCKGSLVCLDCGTAEFAGPKSELRQLTESDPAAAE
jgi:hypothetical protein